MLKLKKNNLFWRFMNSEIPSAEGHEDFVTEALASVLQANENLTRQLLERLLGLRICSEERIEIRTVNGQVY